MIPLTRERLAYLSDQGVRIFLLATLLMVPLVFYTYAHDVFETNKLAVFRVFTLLGLLAFLTRHLLVGSVKFISSKLLYPVALVGVSALLSTLWTNNSYVSIFGVYEDFEGILTIANYILLWFLAHQHIRNLNDVYKFLTAVVLAGTFSAGYGVAQNFGIDFVLWNPATYSATRLFGSLGNPNFLAAYVLMALPPAILFFLINRKLWVKMLLLCAVLIMAGCIFFTKSRGGLYALAAEVSALAVYMIFDARRAGSLWRGNRRWILILGLLATMSLGHPTVRTAIYESVTRTAATLNVHEIHLTPRLYIWRSALQMIRDHPILGSGLDTFQITFPKYRLAEYWQLEWNGTPEKAHNFFLQIGATTGLLGLGAWLWMIGVFFTIMAGFMRNLPPPRRHLALGISVAQLGFLVQNQFSFTVVAYGSLFWFFLALGPALDRDEPQPMEFSPTGEIFSLTTLAAGKWPLYIGSVVVIFLTLFFSLRSWSADLLFKQGIMRFSMQAPEQAIPFLSRAVALDPQREIYWVKLGIAYEEAARRTPQKEPLLQQAMNVHRHTIAMNPLNGYNFNNLGRVYKFWGETLNPTRLQDAEKACWEATRLDPYNVYFALDLASVYLAERRPDEAKRIVERLVKIFPDFAIPYSYLGYVALLKGDDEVAYRELSQAVARNWRGDITTQASTWSNLGIVRARRGDLSGAVAALRKALELGSDYVEARMNLASLLERQGKAQEAADEYRRVLEIAPRYPQANEIRQKINLLERGNTSR